MYGTSTPNSDVDVKGIFIPDGRMEMEARGKDATGKGLAGAQAPVSLVCLFLACLFAGSVSGLHVVQPVQIGVPGGAAVVDTLSRTSPSRAIRSGITEYSVCFFCCFFVSG